MSPKTILGALLAVLVLGFVAFRLPQASHVVVLPAQEQPAAPAATSSPSSTSTPPSAVATSTSGRTSITVAVGTAHYTADVANGTTVIDAMRSLAGEGFSFTGREYPSLGFFVDSIGGKKNADGYYWILYVNGTSSELGASSVVPHSGDAIEWRYEKGYY